MQIKAQKMQKSKAEVRLYREEINVLPRVIRKSTIFSPDLNEMSFRVKSSSLRIISRKFLIYFVREEIRCFLKYLWIKISDGSEVFLSLDELSIEIEIWALG